MNYKQDSIITIDDKRNFLFQLIGDWNLFTLNEIEIDKLYERLKEGIK